MMPLPIIHENLPILVALGVTAVALGSFWGVATYRFARRKRNRLAPAALRCPGQSLLEKLDDLDQNADSSLVCLLLAPLLLYAAYLSCLYFGRREITLAGGAIIGLACIGLIAVFSCCTAAISRKDARCGSNTKAKRPSARNSTG